MKNFLTILGLACFLSASVCIEAKAQTDTSSDINCTGGTVIKAKDGRSFCMSKFEMTWWSAYDWCRTHGLKLAVIEDCNYDNKTFQSTQKCPNFEGVTMNAGWTSSAINKSLTYYIKAGDFSSTYKNWGAHAFCK